MPRRDRDGPVRQPAGPRRAGHPPALPRRAPDRPLARPAPRHPRWPRRQTTCRQQLLHQRREPIDLVLGRRLVRSRLGGRRHLHRHRGGRATTIGARPLAPGRPRTRRRRRRLRCPSPSSAPSPPAPGPAAAGSCAGNAVRADGSSRRRRPGTPAARSGARRAARRRARSAGGRSDAAGHEHAVRANVAHDPVEVAATQRRRVADDDQHRPRPRERHVDPLHQAQKADVAAAVAPHQRDKMTSLSPPSKASTVSISSSQGVAIELPLRGFAVPLAPFWRWLFGGGGASQQRRLLGVRRDDADLDLALGAAQDVAGDRGDEAGLGDVHQRGATASRLAQAVQALVSTQVTAAGKSGTSATRRGALRPERASPRRTPRRSARR